MPVVYEGNSAIYSSEDMTYTTSPKHENSTGVCIKTDASEIEKFGKRLQLVCLLFTSNHTLRNIAIMIVTCPNANIYIPLNELGTTLWEI